MSTKLVIAIANAFKLLLLHSDKVVKEREHSVRIDTVTLVKCPQIQSH